MTKIREEIGTVRPDRFYVWTWRPKEYWKFKNQQEKLLYKKHFCSVPYFTRFHAKRTLVIYLGVDVLSDIHIIKGKNLIKMGITQFPKVFRNKIFFKGKPKSVPRFITPPEYLVDKHRRRYYRIRMYRAIRLGRNNFNNFYALSLYGYRESLDIQYRREKRHKLHQIILQDLQKAERGE